MLPLRCQNNSRRLLPQASRQLAVADVNGIYLRRPMLEKTIRKSARGSAGIQRDPARYVDLEMPQRALQLQAAFADIFPIAPFDRNPGVGLHRFASKSRWLPVHEDAAGENQALCLCAVVNITAIHQCPP